MLVLNKVNKYYPSEKNSLHVLKDIDLEVNAGEFISIMGPSGSGKSTLLSVCAGLDSVDSGSIHLVGENIIGQKEDFLSRIRREKIGFIFQNFQLIKTLNARENVALPLVIAEKKLSEKQMARQAEEMLAKVSLQHRLDHYPSQLSGGEQQRVAIARSFINDPLLLFADEPTGNLDKKNAELVMELLVALNQQKGSTLILVTHDPQVAQQAGIIYRMEDGRLVQENK